MALRRLPLFGAGYDLVIANGVVEHLVGHELGERRVRILLPFVGVLFHPVANFLPVAQRTLRERAVGSIIPKLVPRNRQRQKETRASPCDVARNSTWCESSVEPTEERQP